MTNWIRIHSNIIGVLYAVLSYLMITQRWIFALILGVATGIYTNYFASYIFRKINVRIGELMGSALGQMFMKKK